MSTVFKLSFSSYVTTSDSTNNVQAVRNFKKFKTEESRVIQILFQGKEHHTFQDEIINLQDVTFLFRLKNYKTLVMS